MVRALLASGLLATALLQTGCDTLMDAHPAPVPVEKPTSASGMDCAPSEHISATASGHYNAAASHAGDYQSEISDFWQALYLARFRLMLFDRQEARDALEQAQGLLAKAYQTPQGYSSIYAEGLFTRQGIRVPFYSLLKKGAHRYEPFEDAVEQANQMQIKPLAMKLVSLSLPADRSEVRKHITEALDALGRQDIENPSAAFSEANRALDALFHQLDVQEYDGQLEPQLYFLAAQDFYSRQWYDLSKDALKKAKSAFPKVRSQFPKEHQEQFENHLEQLNNALDEKDPGLFKKLDTHLDALFGLDNDT